MMLSAVEIYMIILVAAALIMLAWNIAWGLGYEHGFKKASAIWEAYEAEADRLAEKYDNITGGG